jgi:hypothetical protein
MTINATDLVIPTSYSEVIYDRVEFDLGDRISGTRFERHIVCFRSRVKDVHFDSSRCTPHESGMIGDFEVCCSSWKVVDRVLERREAVIE